MDAERDPKLSLVRRVFAPRRKIGISVAILAALLVALASPFGLIILSKGHANWITLGNIGQAYGVLSAIALVGVAASIFFQSRQGNAQRIQMVRDYHLELRRMALENPEIYMPCWRPIKAEDLDLKGRQQHLYLHLTITFAWMSYSVGVMTNDALLELCAGIFKGEAGRRYWEVEGETWQTPRSRRRQRFTSLVDKAYEDAKASGPAVMGRTIDTDPEVTRNGFAGSAFGVTASAVAGLSVAALFVSLQQLSHRSRPRAMVKRGS
jgi:hypothetical protein